MVCCLLHSFSSQFQKLYIPLQSVWVYTSHMIIPTYDGSKIQMDIQKNNNSSLKKINFSPIIQ